MHIDRPVKFSETIALHTLCVTVAGVFLRRPTKLRGTQIRFGENPFQTPSSVFLCLKRLTFDFRASIKAFYSIATIDGCILSQ